MASAIPRPSGFLYTRPWLYPRQEHAIFCAERYAIVEASTKSGKTVGCMIWLAEQAMAGRPGQQFWWIAPVYAQARIAYRRLKRGVPPIVYAANDSELTLTLANGATIGFKSAEHPDNLYGEDVWAAVIDEASRCKEEAWHAVRSTLTATQGPIRIIGNVKGRKNWAYHLARKAEAGAPGMRYSKITAADAVAAGVLSAAEIADARAQLPEAVYRELYEAEPSDDQGNPFGLAQIRACVSEARSPDPPGVFGLDLAKKQDWTVLLGLDRQGRTARFDRWQAPWEETVQRVLLIVGQVPTLVDSTGVGDPILERLQRARPGVFSGYHFTAPSKQRLMERLALAIQHREITVPPGPIVAELESFEYVYTRTGVQYSAPEGLFDDCVCGLALAVQARSAGSVGVWVA